MKGKNWKRYTLYGLIAALLGSWAGGVLLIGERNPEARNLSPILTGEGDKILKRACFDCHSNETRWPWYSKVPPLSLGIAYHVSEAREHINFSKWDTLSAHKKGENLQEALHEIKEGDMPLGTYLMLHEEARLSKADVDKITRDISDLYGPQFILPPKKKHTHPGDEDHDDEDETR
ncbi:MAG: heme-binding domain-containing protein [Deltaproteobacteria bacterium]|nr:heme-binding domain-containing protein [Deltaproteobacteria bacterium]